MTKELKLEIEFCDECPYCRYDNVCCASECNHPDGNQNTIVTEAEVREYNRKLIEYGESQHTLFPLPRPDKHPFDIPSWCRLTDKKEE